MKILVFFLVVLLMLGSFFIRATFHSYLFKKMADMERMEEFLICHLAKCTDDPIEENL